MLQENFGDLNKIDVDSEEFLSLPTDIQHEIIMDMKERRKTYKMSRRTALPEVCNCLSCCRVPTSSGNHGKPGKSLKKFHAWKNHGI